LTDCCPYDTGMIKKKNNALRTQRTTCMKWIPPLNWMRPKVPA